MLLRKCWTMFADNRIKNLQESTVLTLAWNIRGKTRFSIGELERIGGEAVLRYFPESEDFKKAQEMGFEPLRGFSDPSREYREDVLDYFMSRITSRERDDFDLYLQTLGINPDNANQISDFALLGYGEARLPSDGFQVINSYENSIPPLQFVTEVAATAHCEVDITTLEINIDDEVIFERDFNNPVDSCAIRLISGENHIGFVNRIQAKTMCSWIDQGYTVSGNIFRKNGRPSEPRYFVFVQIS